MANFMRRLSGRTSDFRREEDGATASIEFCFWALTWSVVFTALVDISTIFHGQNEIMRVVQDANRQMSIQRLKDDAAVKSYIETRLDAAGIKAKSVDVQSNNAVVATSVTVNSDQWSFGMMKRVASFDIEVTQAHIRESIRKSDLDSFYATAVATN